MHHGYPFNQIISGVILFLKLSFICFVFSSLELSSSISFSDCLLSVCSSMCRLLTFSSSIPEPGGQFQPNLAQSIFGKRGFKFNQMKGHALCQGELSLKVRIHWWHQILNLLLQNQLNMSQSILEWRWFEGDEGSHPFPRVVDQPACFITALLRFL